MQPKYAKYCHMGSKYERKHRGISIFLYGRIILWCAPLCRTTAATRTPNRNGIIAQLVIHFNNCSPILHCKTSLPLYMYKRQLSIHSRFVNR